MMIDFILGIFFGALAGMGIGGGGLLVIYLTLFDGIEQRMAQGINLYFFIFASLSAIVYHINKRNINLPFVIICGLSGSIFAFLGSLAASAVDPELLRRVFGWMLVVAGGVTLVKTFLKRKNIFRKTIYKTDGL